MKRFLLFSIAMCIAAASIGAETENDSLTIAGDAAVFRNPADGNPYIECYFGILRDELGFIGTDTGEVRYAGVYLTARLLKSTVEEVSSAQTYFVTSVTGEEEEKRPGIQLFDLLTMPAEPGSYTIEFSAIDNVSKRAGQVVKQISVPDFQGAGFTSSDLELAFMIEPVGDDERPAGNPRLVKEDRLVMPNPKGVFTEGRHGSVYVYSELYGMPESGESDRTLTFRFSIKDALGNTIKKFDEKEFAIPGESVVISDMLNIEDIEPGEYMLLLQASMGPRDMAYAIKPFYVMSKSEDMIEQRRMADIELMVNIAWYHMSEAEKINVQKLTPEGKVNFVKQFWRSRDDDPSNPENPIYDEVVRRYVFANENFSTFEGENDGWKTDRGRVYISYGPYDEVETYDLDARRYPYIKWTYYDLEGRQLFIFANDMTAGVGNYRLVHSTHPHEKYDPAWQQILEETISNENDWRDPRDQTWQSPSGKDH
ncbi:MAG: GWxTD domain-containing protein [Candidatus Zixiibacteriota bacterium]